MSQKHNVALDKVATDGECVLCEDGELTQETGSTENWETGLK